MTPVFAFTILLLIYAVSELVAQRTKAIISTVLTMALLLLAGFWSGVLPSTIFDDAAVSQIGNLVAGLLIVSLGTTIDFPEMRRQWKVVVIGFVGVAAAVLSIIFIGQFLMDRELAVAGSPIFAGGSAATLIMTTALKERGLESLSTFCVALYVTQKFIGIPISSLLLRREAKRFRADPEAVALYQTVPENTGAGVPRKLFQLPARMNRPSVYIAKIGVVACIANLAARATGGRVHYFVMALVMGALFFALGFLDQSILAKTQAGSLITFFTTVVIFTNLATTTPAQVLSVLFPLLITAVLGTLGTFVSGFVLAKALHMGVGLAISIGLSCTYGFPTTMLMPKEIAEAIGQTPEEKQAIENYLLPKMLTAGFVTVTISSVLLAGVVVNML